jgi:hypothetical protein
LAADGAAVRAVREGSYASARRLGDRQRHRRILRRPTGNLAGRLRIAKPTKKMIDGRRLACRADRCATATSGRGSPRSVFVQAQARSFLRSLAYTSLRMALTRIRFSGSVHLICTKRRRWRYKSPLAMMSPSPKSCRDGWLGAPVISR